jgi:hypothetical protein
VLSVDKVKLSFKKSCTGNVIFYLSSTKPKTRICKQKFSFENKGRIQMNKDLNKEAGKENAEVLIIFGQKNTFFLY